MKRPHRFAPSSGFVLLLVSYTLLSCFFAWGYSQPDLERAWYILQRLQRDGFTGLTTSEASMLGALVRREPRLAHALIGRSPLGLVEPASDGWVSLSPSHLLIQAIPPAGLRIVVECRAAPGAYPLSITLETQDVRERLEFSEPGAKTVDWSSKLPALPAWVDLTVVSRSAAVRTDMQPLVRAFAAADDSKGAEP